MAGVAGMVLPSGLVREAEPDVERRPCRPNVSIFQEEKKAERMLLTDLGRGWVVLIFVLVVGAW